MTSSIICANLLICLNLSYMVRTTFPSDVRIPISIIGSIISPSLKMYSFFLLCPAAIFCGLNCVVRLHTIDAVPFLDTMTEHSSPSVHALSCPYPVPSHPTHISISFCSSHADTFSWNACFCVSLSI